MKEEKNHFIKNIEIKNFKCFENFSAEGFGRVNLIGGKNNVGKTAFMEACYIGSNMLDDNYQGFLIEVDVQNIDSKLAQILTILSFHRNPIDFLKNNKVTIPHLNNTKFIINKKSYSYLLDFNLDRETNDITKNTTFISVLDIFNEKLINNIYDLKLLNKEEILNQILNELFQIEKVDVIRNTVMFKQNKEYRSLSQFGDGMKHFLTIIMTLYLNKNSILYLDEIENGIHYTNLDKLWEIILTISKEQNVQVFATTHSKECIESYARVAKKLDDKEITFIKMTQLKDGKIMAGVRDYDMLQYTMTDGHEVRGV